jgi:hypothetical protein
MRSRVLTIGSALGLVLGMTLSGTVSATGGGITAYKVSGAWPPSTWTGNFIAKWDVVRTTQDGVAVWKVTPVEVDGDVQLAKRWTDLSWDFGWTMSFLNAAGSQVAVLPATGFVKGYCPAFSPPAFGPEDATWDWCRGQFYMVPITATQVRVNWRVYATASNGDTAQPFNVTRTGKFY